MTTRAQGKAIRKLHKALADEIQVERAATLTSLGVPCAVRGGWITLLDPDGLAVRLGSSSACGTPKAATKPTAEAIAEALIQYETSGMCHFGKTCGMCDCGRAEQTPERRREWDEHQLDRARAVLALIPPQRCAPSEAELIAVLIGGLGRDDYLSDTVRAITKLFGDQPTVAQAKAEGIREACDQIAGMLARQDADAPFSIRVIDLLEALARQAESVSDHG